MTGGAAAAMRLALGTINFGGRIDGATARSITACALDNGIRWFDTANAYADGAAETILGECLASVRSEVVIATKVGYGQVEGADEGLSRRAMLAAIDSSLRRLRTDYVDVYYLHAPDPSTPAIEMIETLDFLLRQKKIRSFGVSNHASWQILEIAALCDQSRVPRPKVSQVPYNMAMRQLEIEYDAFARRHGIVTHVYNPLAGGLLSGKYRTLDDLQRGARFRDSAHYRDRYWHASFFGLVDRFRALASEHGMSLPHLAYAWLAARRPDDMIVMGPAECEHVTAAIRAVDTVLPTECHDAIDAMYAELFGRARYARCYP